MEKEISLDEFRAGWVFVVVEKKTREIKIFINSKRLYNIHISSAVVFLILYAKTFHTSTL